ncbi:hypothetical protein H0A36_23590 [Endozoicomonas sp. SM1973]|uniref:Uncharacterized protein n=1 Tax=Spartinivicinus marinus TaxID=2994442 RepID=A0A853IEP7_9GAMM|nr:hypothetical protein [Spartinivicinus marinus]MCX4026032.1 hypothetical protein [Spartinivicinus marinus]NYZ69008.1 hypothetical protein [Spartinivicinus marinus]
MDASINRSRNAQTILINMDKSSANKSAIKAYNEACDHPIEVQLVK